jgi:hypothetical protein
VTEIAASEKPKECVIFLGASEYPHLSSELNRPQFEASAQAAEEYFESTTGFNIPHSEILDLFDTGDEVYQQLLAISTFLAVRPGVRAFVYYIGHGGFYKGEQYYLAARNMRKNLEPQTGFLSKSLADHLRAVPDHQGQLFLILDCCFAAQMVKDMESESLDHLETVTANKTLESFATPGVAVLAASSKWDGAKAADTYELTLFTKCLLETLREGILNAPSWLSLSDVANEVSRRIRLTDRTHHGLPQAHAPRQTTLNLATLRIFRNNAPETADLFVEQAGVLKEVREESTAEGPTAEDEQRRTARWPTTIILAG